MYESTLNEKKGGKARFFIIRGNICDAEILKNLFFKIFLFFVKIFFEF